MFMYIVIIRTKSGFTINIFFFFGCVPNNNKYNFSYICLITIISVLSKEFKQARQFCKLKGKKFFPFGDTTLIIFKKLLKIGPTRHCFTKKIITRIIYVLAIPIYFYFKEKTIVFNILKNENSRKTLSIFF